MSAIPANLGRVPNLLAGNILLASMSRTNIDLINLQSQMATGRQINKPSDDSIRSSAIAAMQDALERGEQRLLNLDAAANSLNYLDASLGDASDLILTAKDIASSQIGLTSDSTTRRNQAVVIDEMIRQVFNLANRKTNNLYVFGGSTPTRQPLIEVPHAGGGYRFVAQGSGLTTDIGAGENVPITIGGDNAIGELSARQRSAADLDPDLTLDTRLTDLRGARGLGISLGVIQFAFAGGPSADIDLAGSESLRDISQKITAAIRLYEADQGVTILGAGGVSVSGSGISVDVVPGTLPDPDPQLTFTETAPGASAADLGLSQGTFAATTSTGADLDPRLTLLTPLSAVSSLTLPLDSIRVRFSRPESSTAILVDLSSAQTIGDIKSLIETAVPGVRVQLNESGTGIDIFNEVSGPAMAIEDVAGGVQTASLLGIRTLSLSTSGSVLNNGRGVGIVDGRTHPVTGLPDPSLNTDFTIQLGNGDSFTVDLRPQDLATVQTIIARINEQAAAAETAGDIPAGSFLASLTDDTNGIAFFDQLGLGEMKIERTNNSTAAADLGLLDGAYDAGSAVFVAQDRAGVRVNNLLTSLMDLRDSLRANDSTGITLAGSSLETVVDRLSQTRALVGVYAQRVDLTRTRQEDQQVLDEQLRSSLQDLDYSQASIRFSLLRTQLQAVLTTGASSNQQSLLDFLG